MLTFNLNTVRNYLMRVRAEDLCIICHTKPGTHKLLRQPEGSSGACESCYTKMCKKKNRNLRH